MKIAFTMGVERICLTWFLNIQMKLDDWLASRVDSNPDSQNNDLQNSALIIGLLKIRILYKLCVL